MEVAVQVQGISEVLAVKVGEGKTQEVIDRLKGVQRTLITMGRAGKSRTFFDRAQNFFRREGLLREKELRIGYARFSLIVTVDRQDPKIQVLEGNKIIHEDSLLKCNLKG